MAGTRVQAVTFDVGGTLIEPWPSVGHVYAEVAAAHGTVGLCADTLDRRFTSAWVHNGCRAESRDDWQAVVRDTFHAWPDLANDEAFFNSLYRRFTLPETWHVFEDVVPALESFKAAGIRRGILSNWDGRLRPLLERLDLRRWFEVVVISCEAGCRKPDAAIFRRAADAFGVPPGCVTHVGDSWELDVLGARNAGMNAVQIRRGAGADGAAVCTTLIGLLPRLQTD